MIGLMKGLKMLLGHDMKHIGQLLDVHVTIGVIMHGIIVFGILDRNKRMTYVLSEQ